MAREKECYRSVLERLDQKYPNKAILKINDVAEYTGWSRQRASRYIKKYSNPKQLKELGGIAKEKLASLLA